MDEDDDEIVKEFLVESHENLDQLDQDLIALEADPTNPEMLSSIFRTFHTIKGTCGFLDFTKLEWITHSGESLLSRMRDGKLQLNAEITTALLSLVDAVREILANIETTRREGDADYNALVATLSKLQETPAPATAVESDAKTPTASPPPAAASAAATTTDATEPPPASLTASGAAQPDGRIDQRVEQYLMECYENTDRLDQDLVQLESNPTDEELLARICGTLHTLKSSSGIMRFSATESAAHAGENLLTGLRETTHQLNAEVTTALLSLVDMIRQALVAIETTGKEDEVDYQPLIETLAGLEQTSRITETVSTDAQQPIPVGPARPEDDGVITEAGTARPAQGAQPQPAADPSRFQARAQSVADTSIRVDVGLLDRLMDQVGELVLARNRIMQFATVQEDRGRVTAYQRLDQITSELQEGVMKTRMQPIGTIWNKFPRVVRDLGRECGKKVNLVMDGEDTELDRTLIEAIRDPLTHLVRNAVDHGIETADERLRAGKSETGQLLLRAYHEGGQVNLEITDDGGGIDTEKIMRRALERNLIPVSQAQGISQREVLDLIFRPGFSTAQKITNVSGRGVGMDVVKTNIEKINGTIDIQSELGKGSSIRIKIPLTLAIIPALIIRCAGDRYAIPQANLLELVRLEGDQVEGKIEKIQGAPVYRLRGKLLPLVILKDVLELADTSNDQSPASVPQAVNIVVLQADDRQFGLVVEHVLDTEEIVVKPLGKQVKDIAVFSGATIMGDGNVALILDVLGLAHRARVISEHRDALQTETSVGDEEHVARHETLLLFESAGGQRMTLPLSRVTRLEKFRWADVEQSGQNDVVQYWGQVMPLIHLAQVLSKAQPASGTIRPTAAPAPATPQDEMLEVVVLTLQSRSIGLVVDRILDTVEGSFAVEPLKSRVGVTGTVVVRGQVTELLDLEELIQHANPALLQQLSDIEVGA